MSSYRRARLGDGAETRRLRRLEARAVEAVERVAGELGTLLRAGDSRALAETLYTLLREYRARHGGAGVEAAIVFLEDEGFQVTSPVGTGGGAGSRDGLSDDGEV